MSNSIFDGIVKFETFYEAEGIHPDLGVNWHVIGTAHVRIDYEDGEYWNDITVQDFFMCADTNKQTTPGQFTRLSYYTSPSGCRQKDGTMKPDEWRMKNKDLINDIENKIVENAGKEEDAMVSEFADEVLAYWSAPAAAVKVTLVDIVHVQTEAA